MAKISLLVIVSLALGCSDSAVSRAEVEQSTQTESPPAVEPEQPDRASGTGSPSVSDALSTLGDKAGKATETFGQKLTSANLRRFDVDVDDATLQLIIGINQRCDKQFASYTRKLFIKELAIESLELRENVIQSNSEKALSAELVGLLKEVLSETEPVREQAVELHESEKARKESLKRWKAAVFAEPPMTLADVQLLLRQCKQLAEYTKHLERRHALIAKANSLFHKERERVFWIEYHPYWSDFDYTKLPDKSLLPPHVEAFKKKFGYDECTPVIDKLYGIGQTKLKTTNGYQTPEEILASMGIEGGLSGDYLSNASTLHVLLLLGQASKNSPSLSWNTFGSKSPLSEVAVGIFGEGGFSYNNPDRIQKYGKFWAELIRHRLVQLDPPPKRSDYLKACDEDITFLDNWTKNKKR